MAESKANEQSIPKTASTPAHGMYYYMRKAWRDSEANLEGLRKKMIDWRAGNRITKLEKPTRLDRARTLGYKAKKGVIVFRVVLNRGGRARIRPSVKRRSKRFSVKKILRMNYRWVAEQRVQKAYPNLEVLNSYFLGKDGKHFFFEVIAIDRNIPEIKNDPNFKWVIKPVNRFRTLHGRTSSGIRSRGMSTKTRNLKVRPSLRAWGRRGR